MNNKIFHYFVWVLLLIISAGLFFPFFPDMPREGLDPSWALGMNQAVSENFTFGQDIVFTFGPYSAIYSRLYHPSTDLMILVSSFFITISFWISCVITIQNGKKYWIAAFLIFLSCGLYSREALIYSIPLLAGVASYKLVHANISNHLRFILTVAIYFALGILPLIKGSFLIISFIAITLSVFYFFTHRLWGLAFSAIVTVVLSVLFFWKMAGQELQNLFAYFMNMIPIVSGYTEAMAVKGNKSEIQIFLAASFFILLSIIKIRDIKIITKFFLFTLFTGFLFISFKSGFVRHDAHAITAGIAVLTAALLLQFIQKSYTALIAVVIAFLTLVNITQNYSPSIFFEVNRNLNQNFEFLRSGLKGFNSRENELKTALDKAMQDIKKQENLPVISGTTDIYSYNQADLIASGNTWSPRPVLQSYSAYTPYLAELNRSHLLGDKAPENIIFNIQPIDNNFPSTEDGVSWPILLVNYKPVLFKGKNLILRQNRNSENLEILRPLTSLNLLLGESTAVPESEHPLFVQIDIKPTLLGDIKRTFFKSDQLYIHVELENGAEYEFKLVSGMAKAGFILSPLIQNTYEFGFLYGENKILDKKRVKSFTIKTRKKNKHTWQESYTIHFNELILPYSTDLSLLYHFDQLETDLPVLSEESTIDCIGYIDEIYNRTPAPAEVAYETILPLRGWLLIAGATPKLPDSVYAVLKDNHGKTTAIRMNEKDRPDIGAYFKNTAFNRAGYELLADISSIQEDQTLQLAVMHNGVLQYCSGTQSVVLKH